MAVLTGEQIRQAARDSKIEREKLHVKQLGGEIFVRGMSGTEKDKLEERFRIKQGPNRGQVDLRNFRAIRVCRVVVDEQGARLLNDNDVEMIGRLPAGVLDQIIAKCEELSGSTPEEVEELGNGSGSQAAGDASSSS